MGSAQSTWRIGPGGRSGCAGCLQDISASQFLPTPPLALHVSAGVGGQGPGWGRQGTTRCWRLAAAGCISTAMLWSPGLRDGWEGQWGTWLRRPGFGGGLTPLNVTATLPPAAEFAESWGGATQTYCHSRPPPGAHPRRSCPVRVRSPGVAPVCAGVGGWPLLSRRDRSPTPARLQPSGAGGTVPSAPRAGRAIGPGGCGSPQRPHRLVKRMQVVSGDVGHPPDPF